MNELLLEWKGYVAICPSSFDIFRMTTNAAMGYSEREREETETAERLKTAERKSDNRRIELKKGMGQRLNRGRKEFCCCRDCWKDFQHSCSSQHTPAGCRWGGGDCQQNRPLYASLSIWAARNTSILGRRSERASFRASPPALTPLYTCIWNTENNGALSGEIHYTASFAISLAASMCSVSSVSMTGPWQRVDTCSFTSRPLWTPCLQSS